MNIRKVYFMGIKGVGMCSLALIAKEAGFVVAGSDVKEEFITDKVLADANIDVREGFKAENVDDFVAGLDSNEVIFIATGAHDGFENPEAVRAAEMGIKVISHGEAVGLFMSGILFDRTDIEGVSVAGSHGKTTISAMIATFLVRLNLDPSYAVGTSEILGVGPAGHYGKGKYFVAEADDYLAEGKLDRKAKFLYQKPKYLILNNIDFDHPDFYENIDSVRDEFNKWISELGSSTILIANGDDSNIKKIIGSSKTILYGTAEGNEFVIRNYKAKGLGSTFEVARNGTSLGYFELSVPGYHNAKNALSAIAFLMEIGISVQKIAEVLPEFKGSKRRLESIGKTSRDVAIFDDYAHHPEEIRKTLEALKQAFPDKKITVVFQAHTFERTKSLMSEFVSSFSGVAELIILPTFASARDLGSIDLQQDRDFVEKLRAFQPNVKLIEKLDDVVEYLEANVKNPDQIILTMGAGDVYKIGEKLAK